MKNKSKLYVECMLCGKTVEVDDLSEDAKKLKEKGLRAAIIKIKDEFVNIGERKEVYGFICEDCYREVFLDSKKEGISILANIVIGYIVFTPIVILLLLLISLLFGGATGYLFIKIAIILLTILLILKMPIIALGLYGGIKNLFSKK